MHPECGSGRDDSARPGRAAHGHMSSTQRVSRPGHVGACVLSPELADPPPTPLPTLLQHVDDVMCAVHPEF